jgi:hypothetical protein
MFYIIMLIMVGLNVNSQDFYPVGGDTNTVAKSGPVTNTLEWSSTALPAKKATTTTMQKPKGPPKILGAEQRKALSRITSKGFIVGQKDLPDGRKELTWTNGKDTIVTTQKIERVNGGKAKDARRSEIEAVKAGRDSVKAERDLIKAENADLKAKKDKAVK